MLQIKQFVFNPFGECTYIVWDEDSRDAIIVDPGMIAPAEANRLNDYIAEKKLNITGIVNTHMHLDHCFGANYVHSRYKAPVKAHAADAPLGRSIAAQAARFGIKGLPESGVEIDVPLTDGDTIALGKEAIEVIHVPGHSPGGIALYSPSGKFVLSGDSLFKGSIGRTDLEGGDQHTLVEAVRHRLLSLPDDTLVLPGHGPATTIGDEKTSNPFLL